MKLEFTYSIPVINMTYFCTENIATNTLFTQLRPHTGLKASRPESFWNACCCFPDSQPFGSFFRIRLSPFVGSCARHGLRRCERSSWISNLINTLIRMLTYFVTGQEKHIDFQKQVKGSIDWTIFPAANGSISFPSVSSLDSLPTQTFLQRPSLNLP